MRPRVHVESSGNAADLRVQSVADWSHSALTYAIESAPDANVCARTPVRSAGASLKYFLLRSRYS